MKRSRARFCRLPACTRKRLRHKQAAGRFRIVRGGHGVSPQRQRSQAENIPRSGPALEPGKGSPPQFPCHPAPGRSIVAGPSAEDGVSQPPRNRIDTIPTEPQVPKSSAAPRPQPAVGECSPSFPLSNNMRLVGFGKSMTRTGV